MEWDFIVVGAGSAGCALVNELIRSGRKVLLLEAGGSDRSAFIKIPAAVWKSRRHHEWGYEAQPDPSRAGIVEAWRRGRVLGGTSSINGMVYIRGSAGDFDNWAEVCNGQGGWSASEVMPLYRELECSDQLSPWRGKSGPLHIKTIKHPHSVTEAFVESAWQAGYPYNADYNGAVQEGVGYLQLTQRRGLRWSSADAFLKPILRDGNLKLLSSATVEKVELANGRATSVVFRHSGRLRRETAQNIVLCSGALNTPKLLMLSGVGDPHELARHRIDVLIDLPAVGSHLKEHADTWLEYRSKVPTYNLTEGMMQRLAIGAKYLFRQEGPIAAAYESVGFLKLQPSALIPDVQIFFAPIGWINVNDGYRLAPYPAVKVVIINSHSASSGRVRLTSSDPDDAPLIEMQLLESEADVNTLAQAIETVRSIMKSHPIAELIEAEIAPGERTETRQALREYVRSHCRPACHPMGTCRMGASNDTVVDANMRVHGTENLWIADASIIPKAPSANLNAVCIMIGAKLGRGLTGRR